MKVYTNFNNIVKAIANNDEVDINNTTVSFINTDYIITAFAKIYIDIAEMSATERKDILIMHRFKIKRIIKSIIAEIQDRTNYEPEQINTPGSYPDAYTYCIYNLLQMGIMPTPSLYNIIRDTSYGCLSERSSTVSDVMLNILSAKTPQYYKIIDDDFIQNFITVEHINESSTINNIIGTYIPTTLSEWLSRYEWSDIECEYIKDNFGGFVNLYEKEVLNHD